ncbi:MAG: glycosyltransferase [Ktedonobacteraceae bacterium]|nr:glycosyltransferase [Chloroflexota bacterium]
MKQRIKHEQRQDSAHEQLQDTEHEQLQDSLQQFSILTDRRSKHVMRYRTWLTAQVRHDTAEVERESEEYATRASQIVQVESKRVRTFAPFRYKYSALQTITSKQVAILCLSVLIAVLGLAWRPQPMLVVIVGIIAFWYLLHLILDFSLALGAAHRPAEEQIDEDIVVALKDAAWPLYTILCPLYREAQVVPQFVNAMRALDYPQDKLQILFLTEEDDADTRHAIRSMHLPPHFKIVTVPDGQPRTKPRACNYGLMEATGQYVVIYDAEDVPDPLQLKKAVLTFANHGPDLACVQAKLNFYNPNQNLLTRWFTAEYSLWFDLILPGLQWSGLAIPLGGTSNHFPTQTLRALGGWDAFNVTEDCDLGLRLSWFHLETVVLNSTTYEEANSNYKNWIRQRSRWIKGYMQTYLVHMREPLHYLRSWRLREFLSLQLVIGGKTAVLLINPLMWILLVVSLVFRPWLGGVSSFLYPTPILYISAVTLFLGNFFYGYIYLLGCMKRKQYSLVKWMLLIPIYWAMSSIAACLALYQLITKPHYWEKTEHGLHLSKVGPVDSAEITPEQEWEKLAQLAEDLSPVPAQLPALVHADLTPVQRYARFEAVPVASVLDTLEEMITPRKPALLPSERAALHHIPHDDTADHWLFATFVLACAASVVACWYYFQRQQILLYSDALTHLKVARNVFTGSTPFDLTRLGGSGLPLQHLLMLPFAWNETLWRTGLAGSIPSMLCFVAAAVFLFLLVRRLTHDSRAAFVGALLLILNPNILYAQSTPLADMICIATLLMASYYFLAWAQSDNLMFLILTAGATCLATLADYSGWTLCLTLFALIPLIGLVKRQPHAQVLSNVLVFGLLGVLGIGLWLVWNATVFGDALYFLHAPLASGTPGIYPYHNLWQTLPFSSSPVMAIVALSLAALAVLGFVVFIIRYRFKPEMFTTLALLVPLILYAVAQFSGQVVAAAPQVLPAYVPQHLLDVLFGAALVPAAAVFLATMVSGWHRPLQGRKLALAQVSNSPTPGTSRGEG